MERPGAKEGNLRGGGITNTKQTDDSAANNQIDLVASQVSSSWNACQTQLTVGNACPTTCVALRRDQEAVQA